MPSTGCWNAGFGSVISITIFRAIPEHHGLDVHIGTLPDQGTSLLVDNFLGGNTGPEQW